VERLEKEGRKNRKINLKKKEEKAKVPIGLAANNAIAGEKFQIPSSKLHGSSKSQAPVQRIRQRFFGT
jgi:hypothetical protein